MLEPAKGFADTRKAERILAYGDTKAGKSGLWLDLALRYAEHGNQGHIYIIDTDNAAADVFESDFDHLEGIVVPYLAADWTELKYVTQEIKGQHDPGIEDWIVIDMVDKCWTDVQPAFTRIVYGQEMEEYLFHARTLQEMARAEGKKGHETDFGGFKTDDWIAMTKIYMEWEQDVVLYSKANVLAIAGEQEIGVPGRGTDPKDQSTFGPSTPVSGFKPRGQRRLGHRFRTVMRVVKAGSTRELRLAGDRYREHRWEQHGKRGTLPLGNLMEGEGFVESYLKPIAGWRTEVPTPRRRKVEKVEKVEGVPTRRRR